MKSEKGITITAVIIYVTVFAILVAIVARITVYTSGQVDLSISGVDFNQEYTRFTSYFAKEFNKNENEILEIGTDANGQNYIAFSNGGQYTFINNSIYYNKIKIASGIKNCTFEEVKSSNNKIQVNVVIVSTSGKTRTVTYTLK
jgi:hypothetical protein